MKKAILTISLLTSLFPLASAQSPDGRASGHLFYDKILKAMLLVDGYQIHLDSPRNDVWAWDGRVWTLIKASGPTSKSLSAAAQKTSTGEIFVFAGIGPKNYGSLKSDMWTFDGQRWKEIKINSIGTRDHHEMVYADHLDAFVIYGGVDAKRRSDSCTWIVKEGRIEKLDIPGPGSRVHFAMGYDRHRRKIVLFGGTSNRMMRNDVWEFDGISWTEIKAGQPIAPRTWHSMVYSEHHRMLIVHGGACLVPDSSSNELTREIPTDTWGWNGVAWQKLADNGPGTILPALGYDPLRKTVVLFGGNGADNLLLSGLWELNESGWKKISDNGTWRWVSGAGYKKVE
jgi:hypothetical protein